MGFYFESKQVLYRISIETVVRRKTVSDCERTEIRGGRERERESESGIPGSGVAESLKVFVHCHNIYQLQLPPVLCHAHIGFPAAGLCCLAPSTGAE